MNWLAWGLEIYGTSLDPKLCPTRLSHQGVKHNFSATILAPYGSNVAGVNAYVKNVNGQTVGSGATGFQIPFGGSEPYAQPQISYVAGTTGTTGYDVLHLDVNKLDQYWFYATWYEYVSYTFDSVTTFTGPTTVNTGSTGTWKVTGLSPNPHSFNWYFNNILQSTQTTYQFTYRPVLPIAFSVRVETRDLDSGWQEVPNTWSVIGNFSLTLNGPTNVNVPGGTCSFSVALQGGVAPVTYLWTFDGANVGHAASMQHDVLGQANQTHTLSILVTDSTGTARSIQRILKLVNSGGTTCVQ